MSGVAHGGTFNGNPLGMAAAVATLDVLRDGAAFSLHFTERGELRNYRDTLADDKERLGRFIREALDEGLFLLPDGRIYVSAVHTEREVEETVEVVKRVFARM